jgi:transposase InsO family protein
MRKQALASAWPLIAGINRWRPLKYEAIYLHELTEGFKAERVITEWIDFYNTKRPHSAHRGEHRQKPTPPGCLWI